MTIFNRNILYHLSVVEDNFCRIFNHRNYQEAGNLIVARPIDIRSGISSKLSELIIRCISYDKEQRSSGAAQVVIELLKSDC